MSSTRPKKLRRKERRKGLHPKKKCCTSKPKCQRCPLRMLAAGTLPDGYTVKKRTLVKVEATGKSKKKAGKQKDKRRRLPEAA